MFAAKVFCIGVLMIVLAGELGQAWAQEKGPSCQEQLFVEKTHTQLLGQKRGEVESQLSQVAAQATVLQQKVQLLTKENAELKATLKKLTPATDDKLKE